MKRSLIIAIACVLGSLALSSCSNLRIVVNKRTPEGERTIATSGVNIMKYQDGNVAIGLAVRFVEKDTIFAVTLRCDAKTNHGIFLKGDRMMFRLNDDSEIILKNELDQKYKNDVQTYVTDEYRYAYGCAYAYGPRGRHYYVAPYQIGGMVPTVTVEDNSASYAIYLINKEQFTSILEKGVKKFRVETESADLDMRDPSYLHETLNEIFYCLKGGVKSSMQRTEF